MLFGSYVMPFVIAALAIWPGWRFALVALMASLTTLGITGPMKHYIKRQRPPPFDTPRAFKLRGLVNNPAFPSGDSAQAGALTMLLILLGPLAWPASLVFLPLAPLCMVSRVYFGAHWVGDTVGGVTIGAGVGLCYASWFEVFVRNA